MTVDEFNQLEIGDVVRYDCGRIVLNASVFYIDQTVDAWTQTPMRVISIVPTVIISGGGPLGTPFHVYARNADSLSLLHAKTPKRVADSAPTPAAKAPHIAGISPETIDFDAFKAFL